MGQLPSGTVTFLFTDIEGSTRLLKELGERYDQLLAEHRSAIRIAVERHGGTEVDTQGDGFFVAFERASDAIAAAEAAQTALARAPVRVRMGLHTGEPRVTDEGYVGIDVHRAARIGNAANGGQVVLSESTRQLLDSESELRDLGEHRLKDFAGPARLYQLGTVDFPPLRTLDEARLPLVPTALVGRKKELAVALRLLGDDGARLLTVTGPGGVGKTRFAIEVAGELLERFTDGVRFVDLAPLRSPAGLLPAIGQVVRARAGIEESLRDQQVLLILDNAEHVAAAAPELGSLLEACPDLALLVTSREPLHLALERELPLRPMPEAPAVELFRQRAQRADPGFDGEYGLLAEICARLDGLPLAIELAAARVKLLGVAGLLERLEQRLPLLAGRARDLPERQRTMRAAIEWSYGLLNEEEQRVFAALGAFVGGCTIEAAERVAGAELDTLDSLVTKSLVQQDAGRLSLLETIREFALELTSDETRKAHTDFFLELAEGARPGLAGPDQQSLLNVLEADYPNLRAALGWSAENDPEIELRLVAALGLFWRVRGNLAEAVGWSRDALDKGKSIHPRIEALSMTARLTFAGGDFAWSAANAREAIELARQVGDRRNEAEALVNLANVKATSGELDEAQGLLDHASALFAELDDHRGLARALNNLSNLAKEQGETHLAEEYAMRSVEHAEEVGDERAVCIALINAALAAREEDVGRAVALNLRALDRSQRLGYFETIAFALEELGSLLPQQKAEDAARLLSAASSLRTALAAPRIMGRETAMLTEAIETVRRRLGDERFERSWAEGLALTLEDAIGLARSLHAVG